MSNATNKRVEIDDATRTLLQSNKMPECIELRSRKFFLDSFADSGFKGVVWKGKDEWGRAVAIKFAIPEDYEERSFLDQVRKTQELLEFHDPFAMFMDAGIVELKFETPRKFVCFIEEWVEGDTLERFLKDTKNISHRFLLEFVKMTCVALNILKKKGLCHDDLRASNIKIASVKPEVITDDEYQVKIIDMGSLKSLPSIKDKDDQRWFIEHIISIRNAIHKRKNLMTIEKLCLKAINPLLEKMIDDDPTVALTDYRKISEQFQLTWKKCRNPIEEREEKLYDPFDYISAETISSDKLLVELFAESCPWKKDVLSPDPLVLTGPRGCGKSTIFRRLSLRGMLEKGPEEIKNSNIAGFYISCSTDLKNHVNWINNENLSRKFNREIMHYFNLLVTKEIVKTLNIIGHRLDREEIFGFSELEEKKFYGFLIRKLNITKLERMRLQGVPPMEHSLYLLESELEKCHETMVKNLSLPHVTTTAYISEMSTFLSETIPYMKYRKIVFLVDDLSNRQIPDPVQKVLNDVVLLERPKHHVFKVSSDKYGLCGLDILSSLGEKTREIREIDCGKFFLVDATKKMREKFAVELLEKRMKLAGYKGSPKTIIGKSHYDEGSLGKHIRKQLTNNRNLTRAYHGLDTITDLCCGDISVLLEIYRRIFQKGGVDSNTTTVVSAIDQHKAIVSVSRDIFDQIKNFRPWGKQMHEIVTQFGTLSRNILQYGKPHRQGRTYVYPQTSRIELDEDPSHPHLEFPEKDLALNRELLKRAIFIELDPGRARKKNLPSYRLQLRPVLCPTFSTTRAKNVPIIWTPEEFKDFLRTPEAACEKTFETRFKESGKKDNRFGNNTELLDFTNEKSTK